MTGGEKAQAFQAILKKGDLREIGVTLFNGLETAAFFLMPEVEKIKGQLLEAGAFGALVSGSGPTVFGLAESRTEAKRIGQGLEGKDYSVFVVSTVPEGIY